MIVVASLNGDLARPKNITTKHALQACTRQHSPPTKKPDQMAGLAQL
jgi:hypothetical protein